MTVSISHGSIEGHDDSRCAEAALRAKELSDALLDWVGVGRRTDAFYGEHVATMHCDERKQACVDRLVSVRCF